MYVNQNNHSFSLSHTFWSSNVIALHIKRSHSNGSITLTSYSDKNSSQSSSSLYLVYIAAFFYSFYNEHCSSKLAGFILLLFRHSWPIHLATPHPFLNQKAQSFSEPWCSAIFSFCSCLFVCVHIIRFARGRTEITLISPMLDSQLIKSRW